MYLIRYFYFHCRSSAVKRKVGLQVFKCDDPEMVVAEKRESGIEEIGSKRHNPNSTFCSPVFYLSNLVFFLNT